MSNFRIDPKKQFSKRLARWTAIFWFVYMAWLGTVLVLAPEAGVYSVYMAIIVSVVMILNICQYSSNSKLEKTLFTILDKTEMELKIGNSMLRTSKKDDSDEDGDDNG